MFPFLKSSKKPSEEEGFVHLSLTSQAKITLILGSILPKKSILLSKYYYEVLSLSLKLW